jgi:hypothetical protein
MKLDEKYSDETPLDDDLLANLCSSQEVMGFVFRNESTGYELCCTYKRHRWDYMGRYIQPPKNLGDLRLLAVLLGVPLHNDPP